jgi:hypothetical protein
MMKPVKLYLATPFRTLMNVSLRYHVSVLGLMGVVGSKPQLEMEVPEVEKLLLGHMPNTDGLGDGRSRLARMFREHADKPDFILYLDDDMGVEASTIQRMLAVMCAYDLDVLGAMYPRKKYNTMALAAAAEDPIKRLDLLPHGFANRDMVHLQIAEYEPTGHLWFEEVTGIGTGCMLVSRRCIEKMIDTAPSELTSLDETLGGRTTNIFERVRTPEGKKYSEDHSFCLRWRAMGGRVFTYYGPGTPLIHVGVHEYVAAPETVGTEDRIDEVMKQMKERFGPH